MNYMSIYIHLALISCIITVIILGYILKNKPLKISTKRKLRVLMNILGVNFIGVGGLRWYLFQSLNLKTPELIGTILISTIIGYILGIRAHNRVDLDPQ